MLYSWERVRFFELPEREPKSDFDLDKEEEEDRRNEEDDEEEESDRQERQDDEDDDIYSDDMKASPWTCRNAWLLDGASVIDAT